MLNTVGSGVVVLLLVVEVHAGRSVVLTGKPVEVVGRLVVVTGFIGFDVVGLGRSVDVTGNLVVDTEVVVGRLVVVVEGYLVVVGYLVVGLRVVDVCVGGLEVLCTGGSGVRTTGVEVGGLVVQGGLPEVVVVLLVVLDVGRTLVLTTPGGR